MELPSYLQIEPVGQCNLRCQMCAIQFRQDGPPYGPLAFMAFDDFTALIDRPTSAANAVNASTFWERRK